jgi:hypothetical protein
MSLDTRLREHYQRTSVAPLGGSTAASLDAVRGRAEQVRRRRRRVAVSAGLLVAAVLITALSLSAADLKLLGLGRHPVIGQSPLSQRFTSTIYPYSIAHPADWTITPASAPWPASAKHDRAEQDDTFSAPDGTDWMITAQTVPRGTTPIAWLRHIALPPPDNPAGCFPRLSESAQRRVGGYQAWVHGGTPHGIVCNFTEAYVVVGRRVFRFTAHPSMRTINDHLYDADLFNAMLDSVRFNQ